MLNKPDIPVTEREPEETVLDEVKRMRHIVDTCTLWAQKPKTDEEKRKHIRKPCPECNKRLSEPA